jgi:hypothetical protein
VGNVKEKVRKAREVRKVRKETDARVARTNGQKGHGTPCPYKARGGLGGIGSRSLGCARLRRAALGMTGWGRRIGTPDFIRGYSGWTLRVRKMDSRFGGNDKPDLTEQVPPATRQFGNNPRHKVGGFHVGLRVCRKQIPRLRPLRGLRSG